MKLETAVRYYFRKKQDIVAGVKIPTSYVVSDLVGVFFRESGEGILLYDNKTVSRYIPKDDLFVISKKYLISLSHRRLVNLVKKLAPSNTIVDEIESMIDDSLFNFIRDKRNSRLLEKYDDLSEKQLRNSLDRIHDELVDLSCRPSTLEVKLTRGRLEQDWRDIRDILRNRGSQLRNIVRPNYGYEPTFSNGLNSSVGVSANISSDISYAEASETLSSYTIGSIPGVIATEEAMQNASENLDVFSRYVQNPYIVNDLDGEDLDS